MIPIAIYHCNISIVSRGKGKSAVAAAAYRSGEKITNEWDGMTHDYTRKGGVVHTEIMLPPHAPPSFSDRSTLWNSVELYEKAGNAQLAREIDAALPIELSREEQIRLVREYCSSQFVSRGMCVDFAIHDTDSGNPHCHIMLTMRPLDERGAWAAKSKKEYDLDENGERIRLPSGRYKTHKIDLTGWNDKDNTLLWRKAWADFTNDFLERNGSPERIDHRSNAERGIDEIPTVHMGVAACQMEKKGIATEKGELNRNIQKANRLIREIRAQIGKLKEWIGELFKARETAPEQPPQSPGLANLLMKYLSVQREKSRKYSQSWQRQHAADELKTVAKAVNYLSEHGIFTIDKSRVQNFVGHLTPEEMSRVDDAVKISLALNPMGSIQKLKPIIRSAAAYAPPEVVDGKPPVYPYTPIKSDFEDAETVEEMMLYTELQSAVHAMIQRLEYSFTFNPSLLTSPKRKKQVAEILTEAEKYIWRIPCPLWKVLASGQLARNGRQPDLHGRSPLRRCPLRIDARTPDHPAGGV